MSKELDYYGFRKYAKMITSNTYIKLFNQTKKGLLKAMMENIIEDDKEKNNHFLYLKRNINKYN